MEVRQILFSQILRFFQVTGPAGGNVYGVALAREFQKRYGFLQGPTTVAEYDLETGINFYHGYFADRVVIDRCQIFKNGLVVESKAATDEWESFIDDVASWANGEAGIQLTPWPNAPLGYHSQLEVHCAASLGSATDRFRDLMTVLSGMLHSYGATTPPFELSNVMFHTDITNVGYPKPAAFTLERRNERPYDSNTYFSSAPLKTSDHIRLLNEAEKLLI